MNTKNRWKSVKEAREAYVKLDKKRTSLKAKIDQLKEDLDDALLNDTGAESKITDQIKAAAYQLDAIEKIFPILDIETARLKKLEIVSSEPTRQKARTKLFAETIVKRLIDDYEIFSAELADRTIKRNTPPGGAFIPQEWEFDRNRENDIYRQFIRKAIRSHRALEVSE